LRGPGPERGFVGSRVEAGDIAQNRRSELDPGPMLGAAQRIARVQRLRFGFLEIFQDHRGLENRGVADHQNRRLAERRDFQEPVRLVRQIDIDPFERDALFGQRDHGALHIGAKLVADQSERCGQNHPHDPCNCIKIHAAALDRQEARIHGLAIKPPVIGIGTPVVAG
jgi:hypothetical protein